jgi:exonuclease III
VSKDRFTLVHYNIKELDSLKLRQKNDPQMSAVKDIFKDWDFDFLSVNEIQYDLPNVPNSSLQSIGQNIKIFQDAIGKSGYKTFLSPANTGKNAKRINDQYSTDYLNPSSRELFDEDNFGLFPAQYSNGGIFRCDELKTININTSMRWREFNPNIPWDKFKTNQGNPVNRDIALFDKSFNHVRATVQNKKIDLILLHTIPAYHFRNRETINYLRNHDQLLYLEKYLEKLTVPFIVCGDLNVDINSQNLGAIVLKRLRKKYPFWMDQIPGTHENETLHRTTLDYIFAGNGVQFAQGGVYGLEAGSVEYKLSRKGSDHFPIWAKFQF